MKVVHINASDHGGGAAIAACRHCEAMLQNGIDAIVLTMTKHTHRTYINKYHYGKRTYFPVIYSVLHDNKVKRMNPVGTFSQMNYGYPLHKEKVVREADVIILHWVNNNTLSIKGVEKILELGKPTFWYMHDMFPITGGCHHSLGCDGYKSDCNNCPLVNNPKKKSISFHQLKAKQKHWGRFKNLEFVTPSNWLGDCVQHSTLAHGHKVHVVPNLIDTELFKPLSFDTKEVFGLDANKKTILFSADLSGSVYKGSQYTIDCLKQLDPNKYEGLIIGNMPERLQEIIPMRLIATGYLMDSLSLVIAYNACDTFVISSIAENYPNVVLEAMSCGKPCVGFRTGGIPDLIKHGDNGIIVSSHNAMDLKLGINFLFEDGKRYESFSKNARRMTIEVNSYSQCIRYLKECRLENL